MNGNVGTAPGGVKGPPVVALTTDFGLSDAYAGVLKAVVLRVCPQAQVVDLTHGIPPQDVRAGCLTLAAARPYFPPGTIHVAVVDPGVGSGRAAVAVRTTRDVLLAPDNGLLSFLDDDEICEARRIEAAELWLTPLSATFHGRDLFAPVAGHLARGLPLERVGPPAAGLRRIALPRARTTRGAVQGEILRFDHFGNALTSIRADDLPEGAREVWVGALRTPLVGAYAEVPDGAPLALVGSSGHLEVSVRNGDARRQLGLRAGQEVRVSGDAAC